MQKKTLSSKGFKRLLSVCFCLFAHGPAGPCEVVLLRSLWEQSASQSRGGGGKANNLAGSGRTLDLIRAPPEQTLGAGTFDSVRVCDNNMCKFSHRLPHAGLHSRRLRMHSLHGARGPAMRRLYERQRAHATQPRFDVGGAHIESLIFVAHR